MNNATDGSDERVAGMSRRKLAVGGLGMAAAAAIASSPASASSRAQPDLPLEDRAAIEDLFSRYLWAYDCTDEEEFLAIFAEDALVVGRGKLYRGRDAILGWFRYLIAMRESEGDDIWMHEASQFHFVRSGDNWIVYAYATHFNANAVNATRGVRSLGYFVCECVRAGDEWKFRRLSISTWDRTKVPWKKPLPWADAGQE